MDRRRIATTPIKVTRARALGVTLVFEPPLVLRVESACADHRPWLADLVAIVGPPLGPMDGHPVFGSTRRVLRRQVELDLCGTWLIYVDTDAPLAPSAVELRDWLLSVARRVA